MGIGFRTGVRFSSPPPFINRIVYNNNAVYSIYKTRYLTHLLLKYNIATIAMSNQVIIFENISLIN